MNSPRGITASRKVPVIIKAALAAATVATAIGIAPGNIMFFDDTRVNIVGAQHVGMQAVLTRSAADIESALANSGIV